MGEYTVKRHEEFEAIYGGGMRRVRSGLGVRSFGISAIDLPANFSDYPEHDHSNDGQEEVYTVLDGRATITIDGDDHALEPGVYARVPAGVPRKISTAESPVRVLAIGGTPDAVYEPPAESVEGEPDPMTGEPPAAR
jgi:mannose-6-phosphate isomerase-like protein (cupin superfamily)